MAKLFLFVHAPFKEEHGRFWCESQARDGLIQWASHFSTITVAGQGYGQSGPSESNTFSWAPLDDHPNLKRVSVHVLPPAWTPVEHVRQSPKVKKRVSPLLKSADYRVFSIGGSFGDWGSFCARLCKRHGLGFAVWTDVVYSQVYRKTVKEQRHPIKKAYRFANSQLIKRYERHVIRHADLGLFHGQATFDAYHKLSGTPTLVHDVHLSESDLIPEDFLEAKLERQRDPDQPLHIGYAGRANFMKAPLDWLRVLLSLKALGVPFQATWLGDGDLMPDMRRFIDENGLRDQVALPGFVSDRSQVVSHLRSWDLLLFTHVTKESPRILIEAMMSGTPIVGYAGSFQEDLSKSIDIETFSPIGSINALAAIVAGLAADRPLLSRLAEQTVGAGAQFSEEAVFRHRSELIKRHLAAHAI